jgi:23S rRNA (adenine2503-C2)-methyltransferase
MRNLDPDEIYDQVVVIKNQAEEYFKRPLTNIVFMGMGEPLLNYNNVIEAIHKITKDEGLGMSAKRITLSTVGVPKLIEKLAHEEPKINLAVSLHSAIDEKRSKLMPINEKNNLDQLADALKYWYDTTKRKITYEYVVWKGINDTLEDAIALAKFCGRVPSKVNLIEYNPIDDGPYQQADPKSIDIYTRELEKRGIIVVVRRSRGKDIDAACGQLANKSKV